MWLWALGLARKVPFRYWEYLALAVALIIGLGLYNAHERAIGEARITAKIEAAQKEAQDKIDELSQKQNAAVDARITGRTYEPINLQIPDNCQSVPDDVRMRVNAAHKNGGR